MAKVRVSVEGYGKVTIKIPKTINKKAYVEGVAEAVTKTMQMVSPVEQRKRFHPVLGYGGHRGR